MRYYSVLYQGELDSLEAGRPVPEVLWSRYKDRLNLHQLRRAPRILYREKSPKYIVTIDVPEEVTKRFYVDSSDPRAIRGPIPTECVVSVEPES